MLKHSFNPYYLLTDWKQCWKIYVFIRFFFCGAA